MAGAGTFEITVKGKGGHAAVPHKNIDAVVCGAKIVTDVQTIVSRKTSALDSVVVTISTFHAGTVSNVMPDEAKLTGTLRSLQPETFRWAIDELSRVAKAVGIAKHGGNFVAPNQGSKGRGFRGFGTGGISKRRENGRWFRAR